jgi:hypothetical protein
MRATLLGTLLLAGLGCTNMQPIGPLAKKHPMPPMSADAEPAVVAAPRPKPPAMLIEPGDVSAENTAAVTQKLTNEFEYDWKTIPPAQKTAEVSRYKGGVKVE